MRKQLPLYILLIFLIIMNGFFLFQNFGKSKRKGPKKPDDFIQKKLNFTDKQSENYIQLFAKHRKAMRNFEDEIRISKDVFFNSISKNHVDSSEVDSLASIISRIEKKKDLEIFYHFRKVYDICDDKQKENFEGLVKKALRQSERSKGNRPPPRH